MCRLSLKIASQGHRETQAASRPAAAAAAARPSCLRLSCSTATLSAMFTLIRDGTSPPFGHQLITAPFCFQAQPPLTPLWRGRRRQRPSLIHFHRLRIGGLLLTSGSHASVCRIILGFKQLSAHSFYDKRMGSCGFLSQTATFLT